MMSYSVYVGENDCGYIIADSLNEAEQRAYELHSKEDKSIITVSYTEIINDIY
jgi:hypothetical protein